MSYYGQYTETLVDEVMDLLYDRAYEGIFFVNDPDDLKEKDYQLGMLEIMEAVSKRLETRIKYIRKIEEVE